MIPPHDRTRQGQRSFGQRIFFIEKSKPIS
jgi:hypothetical protein